MNPRPILLAAVILAGACLAFGPRPAGAQDDVEWLGRIHGTTPPAGYYATKATDSTAFTFGRAWKARNPSLRVMSTGQVPGAPPRFRFMESGLRVGAETVPQGVLGPPEGVVEGTFRFPLILVYFADTPVPAYSQPFVQQEFFDGPNGRYKTIPEFYAEISGGRVDLRGETFPWQQSILTRAEAVGSNDGLGGGDSRVGELIVETLASLDDGSVDWGRYDNDGPDGVPNSGDDDGFVDILAVMHSEWGAECSGGGGGVRIWSHKWRLEGAWGDPFVTTTPAAGGGFIRVDDYAIQPVQACQGGAVNQIGVLAHELGHGFGLPDLYATSGGHAGIGEWGLMGSGAWGCRGNGPERPCGMSAWSKAVLGWVAVVTLPPGLDYGNLVIEPVETTGTVYRMNVADGSGEYFLLENRQRIGFDEDLHAPGLLIWQIDSDWVAKRWASNSVNSMASHMGVWLRQADGHNDLASTKSGNRGDAGDPFPGSSGNTAFHVGTVPEARTFGGAPSGLTLVGIAITGSDATARTLTRFQTVSVSVESSLGEEVLLVDGAEVPLSGYSFSSVPFEEHVITAHGGEGLNGRRTGFAEWVDAPGEPSQRAWVTGLEDADLVARFGNPETRLRLTLTGGAFGVAPGVVTLTPTVSAEPDGWWYPEGTEVALWAEPSIGFDFARWSGAATGQPNPALVQMDAPRDLGVEFDLTYGVSQEGYPALVAGRPAELALLAQDGVAPIEWRLEGGSLPEGLTLREDGVVLGAPLEDGSFIVQVWATDARGLDAGAALVLEVVPPPLPAADLVQPLLGMGEPLSTLEEEYLDASGNRNGVYDLGDFRAFYVRHPGFFENAVALASPAMIELPVVRFRKPDGP